MNVSDTINTVNSTLDDPRVSPSAGWEYEDDDDAETMVIDPASETEHESFDSNPAMPTSGLHLMAVAQMQADLKNAAVTNSRGVTSLACGDAPSALMFFQEALYTLRKPGLELRNGAEERGGEMTPEESSILWSESASTLVTAIDLGHLFQEGCLYTYTYAFDFLDDLASGTDILNFAYRTRFYLGLVLFNIAVCRHHFGMASGGNKKSLTLALVAYDVCARVLGDTEAAIGSSDNIKFLMVSVWNNQAEIYYQLQCYDLAADVLRDVHRLSTYLVIQPSLNQFDQEQIENFVANVAVFQVPTTAACA